MKRNILAVSLVGAALVGCDDRAVVKVALANSTATPASETLGLVARNDRASAPHLAMRLSSIYLSEDVDDSLLDRGKVAEVWSNRGCSANGCSFFDLSKSSSELRAQLAAQPVLTSPGTYRYVRLAICGGGSSAANLEWRGPGMDAPRTMKHEQTCAVTSQAFDPPIVLDAGESVTISLSYDLATTAATALVKGTPHDKHFAGCFEDGDSATCVTLPTFVPTVSKLR